MRAAFSRRGLAAALAPAGLCLSLMACGSTPVTVGNADMAPATLDGAAPDAATMTGPDLAPMPDASAGGSSVMGSLGGMSFTNVSTALWLGAPDDPATTVVYVFDKPVMCSELKTMGWDKRITDGTQFLEMKMFGTTPATYMITTSMTPAAGEAAVNYTLSSRAGTPAETFGNSGTVTLTARTAMKSATGAFSVDFGGGDKLDGTYDAVFCPGGHEP